VRLNTLKEKKVLILGLGREGESSFKFLRKLFPNKTIGLADKKNFQQLPKNIQKLLKNDRRVKLYLGERYLDSIRKYQIIIKTPGIPKKLLIPYLNKNHILTSQTEIFFENYRDQIIGITGTKGKSTTASLIYKILKNGGKKAVLLGNIGKPAFSFFDPLSFFEKKKIKNLFVFELSSHQLQDLKISPRVAVFLNIYQEHLDYYQNFQEYLRAKTNITRWQTKNDYFVFNYDFGLLKKLSKTTKAKTIPLTKTNKIKKGCYLKNGAIYYQDVKMVNLSKIPLVGEYYLYNVMAAIAVANIFNISPKIIEKSIKEFQPLKHRLEFVGVFKGIKFYNDSLATIPEATILALKALKKVHTLILGGYDRGQDFSKLIKEIFQSNIRTLIFFPDTGTRIYKLLQNNPKRKIKCFFAKSMKEAVEIAYQNTDKNTICLLSPASASFGLFKDYKHRGNLFKKYVKELAKK